MRLKRKDTQLLVEGWRRLLREMPRADKVEHRENYNHPGLVRDALYTHWVNNNYLFEENFSEKFNNIKDLGYKKKKILDKSIKVIERSLRSINKVEVSCNLVSASKNIPVTCNRSSVNEAWGDIGFLIKPKVVTDSYSKNVGTPYSDVSQGKSVGTRFRKRVRPWKDIDDGKRKVFVPNAKEEVRKNFPLEDEEAYRKSPVGFDYSQSEFTVVAGEVVGILIINIEDWFEEFFDMHFDIGIDACEKLYRDKRIIEKSYLLNLSKKLGIPLYESDSENIFDIPRLQSDL